MKKVPLRRELLDVLEKHGIVIYRFLQTDAFGYVLETNEVVSPEFKEELSSLFAPGVAVGYAKLFPRPEPVKTLPCYAAENIDSGDVCTYDPSTGLVSKARNLK